MSAIILASKPVSAASAAKALERFLDQRQSASMALQNLSSASDKLPLGDDVWHNLSAMMDDLNNKYTDAAVTSGVKRRRSVSAESSAKAQEASAPLPPPSAKRPRKDSEKLAEEPKVEGAPAADEKKSSKKERKKSKGSDEEQEKASDVEPPKTASKKSEKKAKKGSKE
jgi:outer membrane biosynthesis protein TonB